jgi:small subunit ribosomal protein S2
MTAQMEGAGVDLGALEEGNVEEAIAAEAEADAPAEEAAEG